MKREDQRIKVTKILIRDAFIELIKQKSVDKITVKELCNLASINRGTFYTHYQDIFDLYNKVKEDFLVSFKESIEPIIESSKKDNLTSVEFIQSILTALENNKDIVSALVSQRNDDQFINSLVDIGREAVNLTYPKLFQIKTSVDLEYFYTFISGGSVSILLNWITSNMKEPAIKIATILNELIKASLMYFSKENLA